MTEREETVDQLVETVGRFARETLIPAEAEVEENDDISERITRQTKELGLFGMTIAETCRRSAKCGHRHISLGHWATSYSDMVATRSK
jgi:alkylation response protein AidB-like acyl-CoA dehydrogenase